jgi:hypothetical protein
MTMEVGIYGPDQKMRHTLVQIVEDLLKRTLYMEVETDAEDDYTPSSQLDYSVLTGQEVKLSSHFSDASKSYTDIIHEKAAEAGIVELSTGDPFLVIAKVLFHVPFLEDVTAKQRNAAKHITIHALALAMYYEDINIFESIRHFHTLSEAFPGIFTPKVGRV